MPCQCPSLWPIIQVDFGSVKYLLRDNQLTRAIDGNPLSPMNGTVDIFSDLKDKSLIYLLGHVYFVAVF